MNRRKKWMKYIIENIQKFSAIDKKKTAAILCIAAVLIIFLTGFLIGRVAFSRQYTINNFGNALKKKSYYKIKRYVRVESEGRITTKDIRPFADYFSSDDRVASLIASLRNSGKYSEFIELKNNRWLIFNHYYVSVKKVDINVHVNFADTKIYLNDIEMVKSKKDNETVKIKNVMPGIYTIKAVNTNEFDKVATEKEITAVDSHTLSNVELKGVKISIDSETPDADVFINNNKTNYTAGEFVNKGPFKIDSGTEVYIEKTFPWGTIQSEKSKITDNPVIHVKIKLNNEKLDSILNETVEDCLKSIFDAVNAEDVNMIKGDNKQKIYNEFAAERKLLRNQYELSQYDFKINETEIVKKEDTFYANIYTTLKYNVRKQLFGIKLSSDNIEKSVFLKTEMNNEGIWKVVDIYLIK